MTPIGYLLVALLASATGAATGLWVVWALEAASRRLRRRG